MPDCVLCAAVVCVQVQRGMDVLEELETLLGSLHTAGGLAGMEAHSPQLQALSGKFYQVGGWPPSALVQKGAASTDLVACTI